MNYGRFLPLFAVVALVCDGTVIADTDRTAFAPPSAGEGSALFQRLEAARTGLQVENPYDDPRMWGDRYRAFMGGGMGSGVAVGDYDGDGRMDLFVSTKTQPGRLFRNLGDWKFVDVTEEVGLSAGRSRSSWIPEALRSRQEVVWHQGAVFVDVDNDGLLDLYVCRHDAPNRLYMNKGNGRFKEEAERRGLGIVDGSVIGAFADYDRDGWLDVFILTNQVDGTEPAGRPDRLFRNTGGGFFEEVTARAGISGPTFGHSATWIDYDGDGWPDMYVANDFAGADHFYRNNRDGTFTDLIDAVVPHTPYSSMGADLGDINNDGWIDLLVTDMATTTREQDRRGLASNRGDVLKTSRSVKQAPQYMRNALLLNTGRGVFGEAACWAGVDATDWTWSVRFEDFDNDGWVDLHVTNGMVREANNTDLLSGMMRALSDQQRINVMRRSPRLDESNLAYRNIDGTRFEAVTEDWGLGEVGVSFGAATADFDGDGDLDLVYLNYEGGLSVFRNDTAGGHRVQVRLRGERSNRFGVGAVVRVESASGTQTQVLTVARGYASGSELVAHFGLGSDREIHRLVVEWPSGIVQVFRDLEADYAYLIRESAESTGAAAKPASALFRPAAEALGLRLAEGSGLGMPEEEQAFTPFRTDLRGPGVAIADVDGDGREDLYLSATAGSPARLLRWVDGAYASESPSAARPSAVEEGPPLLLDVDGDGKRDLLVTQASADASAWPHGFQPILYANDGEGRFRPTDWLPELAVNVGATCGADLDGDGDLDLFLGARSVPRRYPETPRSVLLRNDGGRFVEVSDGLPDDGRIGLVKSALFRDVDGDGLPDLIVALEWDYVRYFRNEGNGRYSDRTLEAGFHTGGRGWWNSLAAADFNGDGRLDFAAGNLGLNTTYEASSDAPVTLFYGHFSPSGSKLLVESEWDGDELYPRRARVEIGARIPSVLRKFPKTDDFARATLAEVYGEEPLKAADTYQADNFASGVFMSQADGTYRFQPFPREAQTAPVHGLVAADLDGDGAPDVAAVQNSDLAVPRFHGGVGVFLKGSGGGAFAVLHPTASGIVIPGYARALAVFDATGDGAPDLFLTERGGNSGLLAAAGSGDWWRLRLQGDSKNPDAIGAQLRLVDANGRVLYYEIGLGGGWFSQSSPVIFAAAPADGPWIEARVRWPDGHASVHPAPPEPGAWTIRREAGQ